MRVIIKAVESRRSIVEYIQKHVPAAEVCWDRHGSAMETMLRAFRMAGEEPCLHLEDDIVLTKGFVGKVEAAVAERPFELIQFFSMRKADIDIGSRYDGNFLMNQCIYLPAGYSRMLADYNAVWPRRDANPLTQNGTDMMIRDWLKERREKYWIHIPSLVEHREIVSVIDRRRSSKRQSKTFIDPEL